MVRDSPSSSTDWFVQVPLNQLVALQNGIQENEKLRNELQRANSRIDGLHRQLYDLMESVGDIRRLLNVSARRSA